MKKAKLILTAIAVITVVGGALAFKSNFATKKLYFKAADGNCTVETTGVITTSGTGTFADLTTSSGSACVNQKYTTVAD